MKVLELRDLLLEITKVYFSQATVRYTKRSFASKPTNPLVTLTMGTVRRATNPPTRIIDGRPVSFYPATVNVQIDLFTNGRKTDLGPGVTPIVDNTAEDDMLSFMEFLNSDYAVQWCHRHDIAIIVPNTVEDLTGVVSDTSYDFRAMAEIMVNFTMEAIGYTGTLTPESVKHVASETNPAPGHEPGEEYYGGDIQADDVTEVIPATEVTPSGGGDEELTAEEHGYFSNVRINNTLVKKEEK